ncbi:MAG: hypothetical protein SNJ77_01155, partial [Cytophagales bacterium]
SVINSINIPIHIKLASNANVMKIFEENITNPQVKLQKLGWLNNTTLESEVGKSDAILLFPWFSKSRMGVPSKLYEYLSWDVPILVCGEDAGGLRNYLLSIGKVDVLIENAEKLQSCFRRIQNNDFSLCLEPRLLNEKLYFENNLIDDYKHLIESCL